MSLSDITRLVSNIVKPIQNKILLLIGRGVIFAVNNSTDIQQLQISLLADEVKDQVEMFQNYGFTSNPPNKTECIMVSVAGSRDHGVVIATENRLYRLKGVARGDSAIYNQAGKYVWLEGQNLKILAEKLSITNSENELISVLSDFMQEVIDGLVITAIGPQPWTADTIQKLNEQKDKLDSFKV